MEVSVNKVMQECDGYGKACCLYKKECNGMTHCWSSGCASGEPAVPLVHAREIRVEAADTMFHFCWVLHSTDKQRCPSEDTYKQRVASTSMGTYTGHACTHASQRSSRSAAARSAKLHSCYVILKHVPEASFAVGEATCMALD